MLDDKQTNDVANFKYLFASALRCNRPWLAIAWFSLRLFFAACGWNRNRTNYSHWMLRV